MAKQKLSEVGFDDKVEQLKQRARARRGDLGTKDGDAQQEEGAEHHSRDGEHVGTSTGGTKDKSKKKKKSKAPKAKNGKK